jgi:hypothetical protein
MRRGAGRDGPAEEGSEEEREGEVMNRVTVAALLCAFALFSIACGGIGPKPLTTTPQNPGGPEDERLKALRDGKFTTPARKADEDSSLRVFSDAGDFVGEGKTYRYGGNQLVVRSIKGNVIVEVDDWTLEVSPPQGEALKTGEYRNAKRSPSNKESGFNFYGHGRGCNKVAGQFVVWEVEMNGNQVNRLAVDFMMRCEGNGPPLYGMLRYHSKYD